MSQPKIANASDVTWGAHPSRGGVWVKLRSGVSRRFNVRRMREGWELVFCRIGERPSFPPISVNP